MAQYYFDPILGNDTTGDGSAGNPWKTQVHAISVMTVADTLVAVGPLRLEDMFYDVWDKINHAIKTNATIGDVVTANQGDAGAEAWPVTETSTPITGQSLEAGGVGLLGWLSSIRKMVEALKTTIVLAAGTANIGKIAIDDGQYVTLGAKTDAPADVDEDGTARSGISLWKGIKNYLRNLVGQFAAATVTEYNVPLTNANTEYSQALPANCRKLTFRCRRAVEIRYAWVVGKVAGSTAPYQTLKAGANNSIDGIKLAGATIYFACSGGNEVVEMEAWS